MNIICIHTSLQACLLTDPKKNLEFIRKKRQAGTSGPNKVWNHLFVILVIYAKQEEKILRSPSSKYYRILFLQINETEKGGATSVFAVLRAITALSASRFPAHHMMINPFGNQSTSLVKRRLRMMNTIKRRAGIEC